MGELMEAFSFLLPFVGGVLLGGVLSCLSLYVINPVPKDPTFEEMRDSYMERFEATARAIEIERDEEIVRLRKELSQRDCEHRFTTGEFGGDSCVKCGYKPAVPAIPGRIPAQKDITSRG